ncbi:hypothetical protein PSP6_750001 [Paraburkholderia tropica]|uniref:hypothetical protein n=1 Tax=Paraburkholderia tropica TaxID=92647 RepID=UPI001CAC152C|nr:hypothetical protein [Paraburkholderia tropica]CAG9237744.1 hypothetical protein PSP6_750001 [Paraburkholderia tropica]
MKESRLPNGGDATRKASKKTLALAARATLEKEKSMKVKCETAKYVYGAFLIDFALAGFAGLVTAPLLHSASPFRVVAAVGLWSVALWCAFGTASLVVRQLAAR